MIVKKVIVKKMIAKKMIVKKTIVKNGDCRNIKRCKITREEKIKRRNKEKKG